MPLQLSIRIHKYKKTYYHDWGWIKGNNPKPVKISNINEKLDPELTTVYVDGKKIKYRYDVESNILEFNLEKETWDLVQEQ